MSFIILTFLVSIFLTAMFGLSLRHFVHDVSASKPCANAVHGWNRLGSTNTDRHNINAEKALDYIGHLGSIMVIGLLILFRGCYCMR